jgi:hypothetical protein
MTIGTLRSADGEASRINPEGFDSTQECVHGWAGSPGIVEGPTRCLDSIATLISPTSAPSHAILPAAWNFSMGPLSSRSPFCRQFLRKTTTSDRTLIFRDGYRHVAVFSVQARSAIAVPVPGVSALLSWPWRPGLVACRSGYDLLPLRGCVTRH